MGMERGDCGTAGQLLDSAFSPAIYYMYRRGRDAHEWQPCRMHLCASVHRFCVVPGLPTLFPGAQEKELCDGF